MTPRLALAGGHRVGLPVFVRDPDHWEAITGALAFGRGSCSISARDEHHARARGKEKERSRPEEARHALESAIPMATGRSAADTAGVAQALRAGLASGPVRLVHLSKPTLDLRDGVRDLLASRRMRGQFELALQLDAREAQRLDSAHAFGVEMWLLISRGLPTLLELLHPLLESGVSIDQSFGSITHSLVKPGPLCPFWGCARRSG